MEEKKDFQSNLNDFLSKYNIPTDVIGTTLPELSKYILFSLNKESENNRNKATDRATDTINRVVNYGIDSGAISTSESKLGGNFLQEFDNLISLAADETSYKLSATNRLKKIVISSLCKAIISTKTSQPLPTDTILEIKERIDKGTSSLIPDDQNNFNKFYKENFQKAAHQAPDNLLLGEDSNFYKFMMNQDSDKLARVFLEAKPGNPGLLNNLKKEEVTLNCPPDLQKKIVEVMQKVGKRENSPYIHMIKDTWNDIVEAVGKFLNLIKDKEIPGFDKAQTELISCATQKTKKSFTDKHTKKKPTEKASEGYQKEHTEKFKGEKPSIAILKDRNQQTSHHDMVELRRQNEEKNLGKQ